MPIEFKSSNPATDIAAIEEFQRPWKFNLPVCYRDFLLKNNGGRPLQNVFPITGFTDPMGGIQVFFGLGTAVKTSDLNWRIKNRIVPFPDGMLEIACTGGNDLVCIDTKSPDAPVYFFDHRPSWGNGIWRYLRCGSFFVRLFIQTKSENINYMKFYILATILLCPLLATAQLAITVTPPKITGQKAVVQLKIKNDYTDKVKSARAVCFLLDGQGQMVGQSTKWVIGENKTSLEPKGETTFNFVITSSQPFTTTNLTAKVSFTRVVLAGEKLIDPQKAAQIQNPQ